MDREIYSDEDLDILEDILPKIISTLEEYKNEYLFPHAIKRTTKQLGVFNKLYDEIVIEKQKRQSKKEV